MKRRTLGRVTKQGEVKETLVGVNLGTKVLPGEATTLAPATTPLLFLGGLIPGSPLLIIQRLLLARGIPKSSPGVALGGAAELAVACGVKLFHSVMPFPFAAAR